MSQPGRLQPSRLQTGHLLLRGSAWMVGLRWGLRALGLLNTFILARLLTPGDFGLVAMAMVVVGLVEVLGETGQSLALIRLPHPSRADFDSAWTLGLLVAAALTLLLWAVAPFAPRYFGEPRATLLIQLLALRTLLDGCENIGVVAFRKELRFGREALFKLLQRLATIAVTLGCALWLGDWRALVAGILGGRLLGVALSYALHPYRPRLCVTNIPRMLGFSGWMLAVHVAQYIDEKADELVVGGFATATVMGRYSVAADVATAPTAEVVLPVGRALFPVFARIAHDPAAVRAAYLDVFAATCMLSVATGLGMALVARDFVAVALGPAWSAAVPLVQILAIGGGLFGIMQNAIPMLSATGHARISARLTATRAAATLAALAVAGWFGSVETVALTRVAMTLVFIPGVFLVVARVLPVTLTDMLSRVWRPLLAGVPLAAAVWLMHAAAPGATWLRLLLDVAAGAAGYAAGLVVLWRLAGFPAGVEAALLQHVWPARRG